MHRISKLKHAHTEQFKSKLLKTSYSKTKPEIHCRTKSKLRKHDSNLENGTREQNGM